MWKEIMILKLFNQKNLLVITVLYVDFENNLISKKLTIKYKVYNSFINFIYNTNSI